MNQQLHKFPSRPASTNDPDGWRIYWKACGQPWRVEPEIPLHRRRIKPNKDTHSYPFSQFRLTRADIEWLLATHEQGKGPVDYRAKGWGTRCGIEVRGADVRGVNLQGLPLSGLLGGYVDEDGVTTGRCQLLSDTSLAEAGVHLEGANLSHAELAGSCLAGAHLEKAKLFQAALYYADLRSTSLSGAFLVGAHLEYARFCYTALAGVDLRFAHLEGACLTAVEGEGVNLSSAHLVGATLIQCHWAGCNFSKSHMEGVDLRETSICGVGKIFDESHLEGAVLKNLRLVGCTFEGAYLSGAVVEGLHTTHPSALRGAHVEEKEMEETDLMDIRLWVPCFPSHLAPVTLLDTSQQKQAAGVSEEILGVSITTRPAAEFFYEEAVSRGKEELARGHHWPAQRSFQEALRSDPRGPGGAHVLLALSFLHGGSLDQAMDALERDLFAQEQIICSSLVLYLWCRMCQCATGKDYLEKERTWLPLEAERDPIETLEEIGGALVSQEEAAVYSAMLQYARERYQQCLDELDAARKTWTGTFPWMLTFWEALSLASLEEDERALRGVRCAIEEGMPHVLLLPLRWLKEKCRRPYFFDEFIRPLFVEYRLPHRASWGQKERKKSTTVAAKRLEGNV